MNIKAFIKKYFFFIVRIKRYVQITFQRYYFKNRSNAEIFSLVYKKKFWGGYGNTFYSGRGSYDDHIVSEYLEKMKIFLADGHYNVIDAGCGDMNVSSNLLDYCKNYTGIDVVNDLVETHKRNYRSRQNVNFLCLDLANDLIPEGDVIIFRQVLQHLSNQDIKKIISKLNKFKYVIVTEPLPIGPFKPNEDNFTGPDIRLSRNSGVILHEHPFDLKFKKLELICEVQDDNDKAVIKTFKYTINE